MNGFEIDPDDLVPILDGCGGSKLSKEKQEAMLDAATENAKGVYQIQDFKVKAAACVQQWADDDIPLDEGETQADRLKALLIGIVDINDNKEIDEDEADAFNVVVNFALDYMVRHGVNEDDAIDLLSDFDSDLADTVRDFLISELPDDDAAGDDMDSFAFSDGEDMMDAVYKKRMVVRGGKKVKANIRISGTVRRSGAQKAAMKKAQRKSHGAGAMMRRAKSMRMRVKTNLKSFPVK